MKLEGKVAVVTGGGQGIGRGIALCLAKEGADVAIWELNPDTGRAVAQEVQALGRRALPLVTDVTKSEQVKAAAEKTLETFGQIDILVNNVGWDRTELFLETTEATWDKVIAINLKGPIICTRAVLDHMTSRRYGKIISIGSDAGRVGSSGEAVYSACKGGVVAFTKTLARELSRYSINVNCVCPGPTETPLLEEQRKTEFGAKIMTGMERWVPLRRLGQPEDIGWAVAFLASDEAQYITGQTLSVSGGLTMM